MTEVTKQTLSNDLLMRSIKIVDIGYIFTLYYGFGVLFAMIVDRILGPFDEKKYNKLSTTQITIEILLIMWMVGVIAYIVRNIVELIPFPLDGYHGFKHKKVKEIKRTWAFGIIFISCATNLQSRIKYVYNRYKKNLGYTI